MSLLKKIGRLFKSQPTVDRVVGELKKTELGGSIAGLIEIATGDTGRDKFENVLSAAIPIVSGYLGGKGDFEDDVEDLTRQLVQSVFNELKSQALRKLLPKLVKLLGL